ncbi:MAG TPA: chemotaxis protein CheA [Gemmatimonadaceae bacterium]|nr:chemotaxis protein CheA [Gemmatimonadaceae bacterium]
MTRQRYVDLFRAEARERLAEMNASLLAMERGGGADCVAELFRAVHTVKGMSAAMGYETVRDLSHALETLLDKMRRGSIPLSSELTDALFEAVDALEGAIGVLATDPAAPAPDVSNAMAAIEMLSRSEPVEEDHSLMKTMEWPTMRAAARDLMPLSPERGLRSVRVDAQRLDNLMTLIGELVITRGRLQEIARGTRDPVLAEAVLDAARLIGSLQREITTCRMVPVGQAFERFERLVRDIAHSLGKEVMFEIRGSDIEVDKSVLDEIGEPLVHLLRNSLDHGIEVPSERKIAGKPPVARLVLSAARQRSSVLIEVRDDGRGIDVEAVLSRARSAGLIDQDADDLSDAEILSLITRPGFSTTPRVTAMSGRGVGLDVVATKVRSLGGSVELSMAGGKGTTIRLELPSTLAIIHALLARSDDEIFALPTTHVVETLVLQPGMLTMMEGREVISLRGENVPAVRLRDKVGHAPSADGNGHAVVLELPDRRVGLVVDEFIGQQEVVVKTFDAAKGMPQLFNGATILTSGAPALILDAQGIS